MESQLGHVGELTRALSEAQPGSVASGLVRAIDLDESLAPSSRLREDGVRQALLQGIDRLREMRGRLFGGTWEPVDFPRTAERVLCRLGMQRAPMDSIAQEALHGRRNFNAAYQNAQANVEFGLSVYEIAELETLGLGTASISIAGATALGGIALGLAISDAVDQNIANRQELARRLGL